MDEQTGTADELLFEASDMETVANESTKNGTPSPEDNDSSAVEETKEQSESQEQANDDPAVRIDRNYANWRCDRRILGRKKV